MNSKFIIIIFLLFFSLGAWAVRPNDGATCFSPDEPCDKTLTEFIQSAEKSIDVAIYSLSLYTVTNALIEKSRKIPVRVIVDRGNAEGKYSSVRTLIKNNVQVRYGNQISLFHHKFTVVDGEMVETGSFNYSMGATKRNHENQIYLSSPSIVTRYADEFQKMWADADPE
jgi:mitochondrial cardiolipin hydrolase